MRERLRDITAPHSTDEIQARREHLLNVTVVAMGALYLLGALLSGVAFAFGVEDVLLLLFVSGATFLSCILAYWVGRSGRVALAGYIPALTVWAGATGLLALGGWHTVAAVGYVLSVVVVTILSGWLGGAILSIACVLSYWSMGWLFFQGRLPGLSPEPEALLGLNPFILGTTLAATCILVYLFDRQLGTLAAQKLNEARRYADELEEKARERETLIEQLQRTSEQRKRLVTSLHEASTPVLPLFEGLIVMPLVGQLDPQRAERLLDDVLEGIATYGADRVLLDITGMPDIGSDSARSLLKAIRGARLLGSECVLVGVQPAVASELVFLGIDLAEISSHSTLREALAEILAASRSSVDPTDRGGDGGEGGVGE